MNVLTGISILLYAVAAFLAIMVFGFVWWQAVIVIVAAAAAGSYAASSHNR